MSKLPSRQKAKICLLKVKNKFYVFNKNGILVISESSETADYLLRKCSVLTQVVPFLFSNCEMRQPTEAGDTENDELMNLCCSTGTQNLNYFHIFVKFEKKKKNFRQYDGYKATL